MAEAKKPENEEERLKALDDYRLMDSASAPVFDDIIRIAADVCDVDISVIALIGDERQYFLARNNMKPKETPRAIAFCAHAILEPHTTFEIENATRDPRFKDNPLVTGEIGVRFYAAHPLTTEDGYALGGLCLIGKKPKRLTDVQRDTIRNLANIIMTLFDARKKEMEDAAEQKKIEDALVESEERFRALVDNLPSFVSLKDIKGYHHLTNRRYGEIFGYDQHSVVGKVQSEFRPQQEADEARAQEEEVVERRTTVTSQRQFIIDEDARDFLITKVPIFDKDGNVTRIGTIGTDITDLKRTQDALVLAKAEADSANRSKSEFLAAMSHDLRTPLNAIIGFSDAINLQHFGPLDEKYSEYAADIRASGEHLLSLIDNILDLSAIEAGQISLSKENLSLHDAIKECERIIQAEAENAGIDLSVKVPQSIPALYADRRAIKQIVLNLLSNAIKFTPKGGTVALSCAHLNESVILTVRDSGIGIPEDQITVVTLPFVRIETDPYTARDGTGLGLAIVKSLIQLHDGDLEIQSSLGIGTTVQVTFSLSPSVAN